MAGHNMACMTAKHNKEISFQQKKWIWKLPLNLHPAL
jgi:hypothetical protein